MDDSDVFDGATVERNRRRTCNRCRRSRMVIVYTIQYNNNNIVVIYYSKNNSQQKSLFLLQLLVARVSYDFGERVGRICRTTTASLECRITTENEKEHEPGNHCASSRMHGII